MNANLILIGHVGSAPEIKSTQDGKQFLNLSVAVKGLKDQTSWFRITYWEKTAQLIMQYVKKGALVYCECRPYEAEGNDGKKYWNFAGNVIRFLEKAEKSGPKAEVYDDVPF